MTDTNNISMTSMLQVGTLLHGGKYRIEKYLSSGGFGNTYVAIDTTFDNEVVVLKEFFIRGINERDNNSLSISVSNESNKPQFEEQKEKFWREAKRLRLLKHPNIVGVHDRFEENGTAYYVMDFIDGKSISEILKRDKKPYDEQQALNIIEKVVEALGVVHGKQMFHMDIKPGNIMLDKDGQVKLIDFGASKQVVAGKNSAISVSTSGFCFTPGYAPSEQVNQLGKNIGPWTDFYAVGGTLYNLLTLLTPPSMSDILEDEDDAFELPEGISTHTKQLILWMMRPQRAYRPQSAAELLEALRGGEIPDRRRKPAITQRPITKAPAEDVAEQKPVSVVQTVEVVADTVPPKEQEPENKPQPAVTVKPKKPETPETSRKDTPVPVEPVTVEIVQEAEPKGNNRVRIYVIAGVLFGAILSAVLYKVFTGNSAEPAVVNADTTAVSAQTTDSTASDNVAVPVQTTEPAKTDKDSVAVTTAQPVTQPVQSQPVQQYTAPVQTQHAASASQTSATRTTRRNTHTATNGASASTAPVRSSRQTSSSGGGKPSGGGSSSPINRD